MLRASSQDEGFDANLKAVMSTDRGDPGVLHADMLRKLAESTLQGRWDDLAIHRQEAAATIGNSIDGGCIVGSACGFNGITRVADATGIPIDYYEDELGKNIRSRIGVDAFQYAEKSARYG